MIALPRANPLLDALESSERHFKTLIEQAADGIIVSGADGRITLANTRACEITGYEPEEIVGVEILSTYVPEDWEVGRQRLLQLPPGQVLRFERRLRRKDGSLLPVEVSAAWLPDGERQSILRDISVRRRAEEHQLAEERRLAALVRLGELETGSPKELLDGTLEAVLALTRSPYGYLYLYDEPSQLLSLHAWSRDAMADCRIPSPLRVVELSATGLWGEPIRTRRAVVLNDFSADHPAKHGLPAGHAPIERFLSIPVFSRGKIVGLVGVANKATDYTESDISRLAQTMDAAWKIVERQRAEEALRRLAEELEHRVDERTRELEQANNELEAANVELAAANRQLASLLIEQERLQAELAYRAMHDPLTGLGNRRLFAERLEHATRKSPRGAAVIWIDLDHFKEVNDIFGHEVGDEMLVAVAERLRDVVRETDDIARMGGDEFAIVLPNVVEIEARHVADRILAALTDNDAFRLQLGASVGVAWKHPLPGDGPVLVRQADEAMYRAKSSGGARAVMY